MRARERGAKECSVQQTRGTQAPAACLRGTRQRAGTAGADAANSSCRTALASSKNSTPDKPPTLGPLVLPKHLTDTARASSDGGSGASAGSHSARATHTHSTGAAAPARRQGLQGLKAGAAPLAGIATHRRPADTSEAQTTHRTSEDDASAQASCAGWAGKATDCQQVKAVAACNMY